jgi:hypothetical protein
MAKNPVRAIDLKRAAASPRLNVRGDLLMSHLERAGLSTLNEGQTVEYELVTNRGKTSAENLKVS